MRRIDHVLSTAEKVRGRDTVPDPADRRGDDRLGARGGRMAGA